MFKRLYSHYLLLDGGAVPQLITDRGPLYCLHATYQLSVFDSTACINFLLVCVCGTDSWTPHSAAAGRFQQFKRTRTRVYVCVCVCARGRALSYNNKTHSDNSIHGLLQIAGFS